MARFFKKKHCRNFSQFFPIRRRRPFNFQNWICLKVVKAKMAHFCLTFFFKKWANTGLFFVCFRSFQTNFNTIFSKYQREKMSIPSSIWCRDLNPWPFDHESAPITTRPLLPPFLFNFYPWAKFSHAFTILYWNGALWLDVPSHMANFKQSDCLISACHSYTMVMMSAVFPRTGET